jgi:hypothetical protein
MAFSEKTARKQYVETIARIPEFSKDILAKVDKELDAAVFAAYGWPVDLSDDETLCVARLLALNLERATYGH